MYTCPLGMCAPTIPCICLPLHLSTPAPTLAFVVTLICAYLCMQLCPCWFPLPGHSHLALLFVLTCACLAFVHAHSGSFMCVHSVCLPCVHLLLHCCCCCCVYMHMCASLSLAWWMCICPVLGEPHCNSIISYWYYYGVLPFVFGVKKICKTQERLVILTLYVLHKLEVIVGVKKQERCMAHTAIFGCVTV